MRRRGRRVWRIRYDLFWSELFARFAGPAKPGSPRFEIHAELARLYFELADAYRREKNPQRAAEFEVLGAYHARESEPPDLPPAVADALAVSNTRYQRTDARAR